MGSCFAPDCNHTYKSGCKMYRFPTNMKLLKQWLKLLRRADAKPTKFSVVCSCHFMEGNKENMPTIYERNKNKLFSYTDPEVRKPSTILRDLSSTSSNVLAIENEEAISHHQENKSLASTSSSLLTAENYFLKQEVKTLTSQLSSLSTRFSYECIKNNDKLISLYTGIPTNQIFQTLLAYLTAFDINYYNGWKVEKINKQDQILMTLMKLRLNLLQEDLAVRFNCSQSSVSNIILTWIHVLHEALYVELIKSSIPSAAKNKTCLPSAFSNFTNCRIVIDCTEVYTAIPNNLNKQKLTFSNYKRKNTLKGLIGVAPNGAVTFVSGLYPGSVSDKKIVEHCGILSHLNPGDLILADKGFLIKDLLPAGVALNIPPFLINKQFSSTEIQQTASIAKARIHVERAICKMKTYQILHFIPSTLRPYSSKIYQVCATLTNLQFPLIKEIEQFLE